MDNKTKDKLIELCKKSRYNTESWYYVKSNEYKQINNMYESNEKEVVDILYDMALDVSTGDMWENNNYIFILHYILFEHERHNDDIAYLKLAYRKIILEIFENDKYAKWRTFNNITVIGFTKDEAEDLYRSHVETETDPRVIKKYKFEILRHEYDRLYPGIFDFIIHILEIHDPSEEKMEMLQFNIDLEVKKHSEKIIYEWVNLFLNNKYASKDAKDLLKQVKIGGSTYDRSGTSYE